MGTKNLRLIKARNLFPCWDEPIYKAEFEISLKHPKNLTALSNMPVKNNYVTEDKNIVTCFNKTPRLSPHSIGVAITNYPVTRNFINNVAVYSIENNTTFFGNYVHSLKLILSLLNNYTGISYPLPKIDSVIMTGKEDGCINNLGLIFYKNK